MQQKRSGGSGHPKETQQCLAHEGCLPMEIERERLKLKEKMG